MDGLIDWLISIFGYLFLLYNEKLITRSICMHFTHTHTDMYVCMYVCMYVFYVYIFIDVLSIT